MAATLKDVMEYMSTPGNPVKISEIKVLDDVEKNELRALVGAEIGK